MRRFLAWGLAFLFISSGVARGAGPYLDLDDIRPGMKGFMLTVFEGTRAEKVPVEVVDVIRHIGPGRDVIIVRLLGEHIRKTGVARGMSGSPVYVGGKLIGALAFAWPYLSEPVAGVTPIASMMRVKPVDAGGEVVLGRMTWRAGDAIPSAGLLARALSPSPAAPLLRPASMQVLRTPIAVSGFSNASTALLSEHLRAFDFSVVQGGAAGKADVPPDLKLEPGGTITVQLMRGDLEATGIGAVTEVVDGRVYAFGHPLLNSGRIELPMGTGKVHMVVPSRQMSFKLSSAGRLVGTLILDHASGLSGEIGKVPEMIPVSYTVRRRDVAGDQRFNFEVVRDPRLMLSLVNAAIRGGFLVSGKPETEARVNVKVTIEVEGYPPLEIAEIYGGPQAPIGATGTLVRPLGNLIHNPYAEVKIKSLRVTAEIIPGDPRAIIRYVETEKHDYRAGEEVDLSVTLQPWRGKIIIRHYKIKLPDDLPLGRLTLLVCDSATDSRMESREMPHRSRPKDVAGILDFFRRKRASTNIVFRLSRLRPGMALDGREMPRLPDSVISVLGKQPPIEVSRFTSTTVKRVGTEFVVIGRQPVHIQIVKD